MVFYERACGARMHANYFRPGGVHQDLPPDLIEDIGKFCDHHNKVLDDIEGRTLASQRKDGEAADHQVAEPAARVAACARAARRR